jgi:hypothetical protein
MSTTRFLQNQKYQSCIDACNNCAESCEFCATECLREEDVMVFLDSEAELSGENQTEVVLKVVDNTPIRQCKELKS